MSTTCRSYTLDTTPWRYFSSWSDVIAHVRAGKPLWYHAPMDRHPVLVAASTGGRVVRIAATHGTPRFSADRTHLNRMRHT